jgi:hypothetical protein
MKKRKKAQSDEIVVKTITLSSTVWILSLEDISQVVTNSRRKDVVIDCSENWRELSWAAVTEEEAVDVERDLASRLVEEDEEEKDTWQSHVVVISVKETSSHSNWDSVLLSEDEKDWHVADGWWVGHLWRPLPESDPLQWIWTSPPDWQTKVWFSITPSWQSATNSIIAFSLEIFLV